MELPHCYQGKTHVPAPSGKFVDLITHTKLDPSIIYSYVSNKGKYVVGCTDIITGPDSQNGCLFRMFYPTKLNDIYASVLISTSQLNLFNKNFFFE